MDDASDFLAFVHDHLAKPRRNTRSERSSVHCVPPARARLAGVVVDADEGTVHLVADDDEWTDAVGEVEQLVRDRAPGRRVHSARAAGGALKVRRTPGTRVSDADDPDRGDVALRPGMQVEVDLTVPGGWIGEKWCGAVVQADHVRVTGVDEDDDDDSSDPGVTGDLPPGFAPPALPDLEPADEADDALTVAGDFDTQVCISRTG